MTETTTETITITPQSRDLLNRLELWRDGKSGPPKQFPRRLELRISPVEWQGLERIRAATEEDRSEIVRRLIREADPGA